MSNPMSDAPIDEQPPILDDSQPPTAEEVPTLTSEMLATLEPEKGVLEAPTLTSEMLATLEPETGRAPKRAREESVDEYPSPPSSDGSDAHSESSSSSCRPNRSESSRSTSSGSSMSNRSYSHSSKDSRENHAQSNNTNGGNRSLSYEEQTDDEEGEHTDEEHSEASVHGESVVQQEQETDNAHPPNNTDHNDTAKSIPSTSTFSVIEGSMSVGSLHPSEVLGHVLSQERAKWLGSVGKAIVNKWKRSGNEGSEITDGDNTTTLPMRRSNAEVIAVDGAKELLSRFDRALAIATRHFNATHLVKQNADGSDLDFTRIMKDKLRGMAEWMMASYPFPEVEKIKSLPVSAVAAAAVSSNSDSQPANNSGDQGSARLTRSAVIAKRQQWVVEADRWLTSVLGVLIDPLGSQFGFSSDTIKRVAYIFRRGKAARRIGSREHLFGAESPVGEGLATYWDRIFFLAALSLDSGPNPFIEGYLPRMLESDFVLMPQQATDHSAKHQHNSQDYANPQTNARGGRQRPRPQKYQEQLARVTKRQRAEGSLSKAHQKQAVNNKEPKNRPSSYEEKRQRKKFDYNNRQRNNKNNNNNNNNNNSKKNNNRSNAPMIGPQKMIGPVYAPTKGKAKQQQDPNPRIGFRGGVMNSK